MDDLLRFTGKDLQELTMEEWLEGKPDVLQPIAARWFDVICHCGDDVDGIFHDNYPIGCVNSAPFAYVNAFSAHVNVGFFYGVDLPDPEGLLQGTGKRMRHVKIKPGQPMNAQALEALLHLAYADIKARQGERLF